MTNKDNVSTTGDGEFVDWMKKIEKDAIKQVERELEEKKKNSKNRR